jgi:methionyl-tRNA formyltransferase
MSNNQTVFPPPWRVVIFTTSGEGGAFSFLEGLLSELGHQIVAVVTTPGPKNRRSRDYLSVINAANGRTNVIVSTHPSMWSTMLAPLKPDLIISAAFPLRIPLDVINLPRLGAINGHDALLPKYRGPNPQGWVFRNGDAETGYTIHRLEWEFDTGPILSQVRIPVSDDDDFDSLVERLVPSLTGLFTGALDRVAKGERGESQDESLATHAPVFDESWRRIDWAQPARVIHNQVRSWIGFPGSPRGAVGQIEGDNTLVYKTRLVLDAAPNERFPPGSVLSRSGDEMSIQCGDGPLQILIWFTPSKSEDLEE